MKSVQCMSSDSLIPFANTLALALTVVYAYFGAKEIDDRKLTAASFLWMPRSY